MRRNRSLRSVRVTSRDTLVDMRLAVQLPSHAKKAQATIAAPISHTPVRFPFFAYSSMMMASIAGRNSSITVPPILMHICTLMRPR